MAGGNAAGGGRARWAAADLRRGTMEDRREGGADSHRRSGKAGMGEAGFRYGDVVDTPRGGRIRVAPRVKNAWPGSRRVVKGRPQSGALRGKVSAVATPTVQSD